ncbi:hypothetical protein CONPUDRAFT_150896 [Coniophora puteana RWD-64-598 SS2]|uniref:Uncharacterized protein n=1 Tax=Coniophora puteana (strain RWD-64-598) TaxID=741705 RepID=A0A5M3MXF3_CONPW|nr:uncharacterized protein CONPUDRAFT_150896 [Coniophora puteana RWD-64-598 SS2]EIW83843.1 hypothetical protein CONPUDRAFT_150896 [Coniophora puteana RWD-64-598 SS2]
MSVGAASVPSQLERECLTDASPDWAQRLPNSITSRAPGVLATHEGVMRSCALDQAGTG